MPPTCPHDYSCTFTLLHPRVIEHATNPWWQRGGGVVVAILTVLVLGAVLAYAVAVVADYRKGKLQARERELDRRHKLAMEEQRTFQAEQAKGDPELLRLIRKG